MAAILLALLAVGCGCPNYDIKGDNWWGITSEKPEWITNETPR